MSIVERALRRLQESRSTLGAPAPPVVGSPRTIPTAATPAAADDSTSLGRLVQRPQPSGAAAVPDSPHSVISIDRVALRSSGLLPPEHQERRLADEYRQIKRPLIANALGRGGARVANGHMIMLASAVAGEGKTFTCINLALSLSHEKDFSVLLVDADVAKPHISRLFGVAGVPGLVDVLSDETLDVESVIHHTDVPRLSILPVGRKTDIATELLASSRMEQTVAAIAARDPRRLVLFDSSPLLLTSESRALAQVVGQIVLVVRSGATSQQAVQDAVALLGTGKSVGLVLNQCEYGESASYGYGTYGATEAKSE